MKNIKIYLGALIFLGAGMFSSCTDLDNPPIDVVTVIDTEDEVAAILLAAYTNVYGLMGHNGYFSMQEVSSDEALIPQRGGDWGDGGVWLRCHRHEWNDQEDYINNVWTGLYSGINQINSGFIDFADNPGLTDELKAELRCLRAMFYVMLLDTYGNIRVITEAGDQGQLSRAAAYNFILSEITEIKPLLTPSAGTTYGRMNYWVAVAMEAKLKLNAEVYTGTPDWQGAVDAANDIIDNGPYLFSPTYSTMFDAKNGANQEHIYAIPYDRNFAQGFVLPQMTLHYGSQSTFNTTDQPWNGYASLASFYNSYVDPGINPGPQGQVVSSTAPDGSLTSGTLDSRLSNFIVGPQFASSGARLIDDSPSAANDPDGTPLTFTPFINEHFPNAFRQAGARLGKYAFELGTTPNLNNDFPVFRYSDILLTKAEALWRMNPADMDALMLVNQIRGRAGVDPFMSLDADKILAERGREMFIETWRRNDQIRFGTWTSADWDFHTATNNPDLNIFPIARVQIEAGNGLEQNPGY